MRKYYHKPRDDRLQPVILVISTPSSVISSVSRDISLPLSSRAWPRDLSTSVEMTLALLVISSLTLNVISTKRSAWRDLYCVTNTLQLPSFSPRSTYFCSISLSSSFCMAAMLMPVSSLISASVSVGCVRIAFRIFV